MEKISYIRKSEAGYRTDRVKKSELKKMLRLKGKGLTNEEIADELYRSVKTVAKHLRQFQETEDIAVQEDPLIIKAREQHFLDIENLGRDVIRLLDEFLAWLLDECNKGLPSTPTDHDEARKKALNRRYIIRRNPLFKCLKLHVRDDRLWDSWDQLYDTLGRYGIMNSLIERNKNLQEIKEIWKRYDATVDWDSNSPDDISDDLYSQMLHIVFSVKDNLTLAISRRVFPGICPACPTDYRTELP